MIYYSYDEFFEAKMKEFVNYDEPKEGDPISTGLFNPNAPDGPKDKPLGVTLKLPKFKGWD